MAACGMFAAESRAWSPEGWKDGPVRNEASCCSCLNAGCSINGVHVQSASAIQVRRWLLMGRGLSVFTLLTSAAVP
jgi:hypothetical protein